MDPTAKLDAVLAALGSGTALPDAAALLVASTAFDQAAVAALPRIGQLAPQKQKQLLRYGLQLMGIGTPAWIL